MRKGAALHVCRDEPHSLRSLAVLVLCLAVVSTGCSGPEGGPGAAQSEAADYVFRDGKVYTVTDRQGWAEAVAIRGNTIVFVGSSVEADAFAGAGTEIIELGGRMLLPGFVSAHDHLLASTWQPGDEASAARVPEEELRSSQKASFAAASAAGITAYLNPGVVTPQVDTAQRMYEDHQRNLDMLQELDAQGALTLRSFLQPVYRNPDADPEWFVDRAADFANRYNSDRLRSFGIKLHPEEGWTSHAALQLEPYSDNPGNAGVALVTAARMRALVLAANALNLDVITHVDGSATARAKLDAIEASLRAGHTQARNALHHLSWVHPQDLLRIMAMHLPVNVTPIFSTDWLDRKDLAVQLLGEERVGQQLSTYPLIFNNGNRVSLAADVPASPLALIGPLFSMEAAMTLQDPGNPDSQVFPAPRKGISLQQAIKGVTLFPAWQLRMEDKIGTLEVGKLADLVILEKNLFDVAPRDIADVEVTATLMDGRFTHRDGI